MFRWHYQGFKNVRLNHREQNQNCQKELLIEWPIWTLRAWFSTVLSTSGHPKCSFKATSAARRTLHFCTRGQRLFTWDKPNTGRTTSNSPQLLLLFAQHQVAKPRCGIQFSVAAFNSLNQRGLSSWKSSSYHTLYCNCMTEEPPPCPKPTSLPTVLRTSTRSLFISLITEHLKCFVSNMKND